MANGAGYDVCSYYALIGSRMRASYWYQKQLPQMTLNGVMTADPRYLCGN